MKTGWTLGASQALGAAARTAVLGAALQMAGAGLCAAQAPAAVAASAVPHDYPTILRVEFVQECINTNGGAFALMYQCSCALDRLREVYDADDFVEVTTFTKYATLGGERAGVFRDSDRARTLVRKFRVAQGEAYKSCGVVHQARSAPAR